jgi:hypothetical protein
MIVKLDLASVVISAVTASMIFLAGTSANAADVAIARVFGPGVLLGNMIKPAINGLAVIPVSVEEKQESILYAYVVFDNKTCAELTQGAWTTNIKPTSGSETLAPYTWTVAPGHPCSGHTYTGAGIYYASKNTAAQTKTDMIVATWTANYGTLHYKYYDEFKITITP